MKKFILLILLFVFPNLAGAGEYYYVNTYEFVSKQNRESSGNELYLKTINLDTKAIVESIKLQNRGYINNGIPIELSVGRTKYIISFNEYGCFAKNGGLGEPRAVFYTICMIDSGIPTVAKFDSIPGGWIDECRQHLGENGFNFGVRNDSDRTFLISDGYYTINKNLDFFYIDSVPKVGDDEIVKPPFDVLVPITNAIKYNLYYGWKDSQYWVVKLDTMTQTVEKYSQLRFSGGAATLFAYHPKRDLFYCLKVNYEIPSDEPDFKPKTRLDYYIDPEVVIYDPESLDIIKRIPIADYPDGEYPGKENGSADVVGDYIVYYFFREELYTRYDPAMLLIFDTRTNEATWLRVGWR